MKTEYDKLSDSIYIYLSEFKKIKKTISCDPLKIKQEVINFDIGFNNKIVGIEIIEGKFLKNYIKMRGKLTIIYSSVKNNLEIIFNEGFLNYSYINDDKAYDEQDIFFKNIIINFDKDDNILGITFKNADKILNLDEICLGNKWVEL